MDVLKPHLEWIGNICYRVNPLNLGNYTTAHETSYMEPDVETYCLEATDDDVECVTVDDNGRCRASFHVPQAYFAYIIGAKGGTKRNIEQSTKTQIMIPKQGKDGDIVVTGSSKRDVASARTRILMMVKGARSRKKPTHFISIPLTHDTFKRNFLKFKSSVLENCPDRGVVESVFINENKLHITVVLFVICDETERRETAEALRKCKETVIGPVLQGRPLKLKMEGLDYMNDDPSEVNVLFANVVGEDSSLLQKLVDGIMDFFGDLAPTKQEPRKSVKIHATLMNTVYSSNNEDTKTTFDASNILKLYSDYSFGEAVVDKIDMSIIHTVCPKTGYYNATESIDLNYF
ncbi:activating signal cointegrator 1 complex subunit 1 [Cimex lectularius]|uniref:K Homology domain-containing protein n=1 Tax=Cimex lectularius TaxID=79782 RepID=A0A8I6TMH6_CIMLE|nr:activating signal cointegrator 1 complex subunit 1 [Cimex lectularius]XP_024083932.1 activating signal cointegrator 1 complex subunit 1 [Cimex lectularius]